MAKPLTDQERQAIAAEFPTGKSCRQIAAQFGRSTQTVSVIAQNVGHTFGRVNTSRAQEARVAYDREARAVIAAQAAERAQKLLSGFDEKQPVVVQTKDGAFPIDVELDARGQKDRAQAVQLLTRTVLDIARHDSAADEGRARGLLERLIDGIEGAA